MLRAPTERDADALAGIVDDAPRELDAALAHWRAHGFGHWLIELGGSVVGVLEVHLAGPGIGGIEPDEVEIGWVVAGDARGRGIATEAARAAAADAFRRTDALWLVAYIRPPNCASIRIAEKLGMRHVGDGTTRSGDPMLIYRLWPEEPV